MKLEPNITRGVKDPDGRQIDDGKLSAVQYLQFNVNGNVPIAIGCDYEADNLNDEYVFSKEQQQGIAEDLK